MFETIAERLQNPASLRAVQHTLGLGDDTAPGDVCREVHRIFRAAFSTPDGRKALNVLMGELQAFSTSYPCENPDRARTRHVLQDFAQFLRIELLGAVDTIALTDALLDAAQKYA